MRTILLYTVDKFIVFRKNWNFLRYVYILSAELVFAVIKQKDPFHDGTTNGHRLKKWFPF